MPEQATFDIVVAGGGHNGLAAAAYLAKAGFKVCVLEAHDVYGGGVVTEELTVPGFKHNTHAAFMVNIYTVKDELDLGKYGLEIIETGKAISATFLDGKCIHLYTDVDRMCQQVEKFSKRDAAAWRELVETYKNTGPMFSAGRWANVAAQPSAMYLGFEGSIEGREFLKLMQMRPRDIVNNWFEDPYLKGLLFTWLNQAEMTDDSLGFGIMFVLYIACTAVGVQRWGVAKGGTGMVSHAMARLIRDHGGLVKTSAKVTKINTGNGIAKSVVTADGSEYIARKAVISNINHQITLLDLVGEDKIPAALAKKIKQWRWSEMVLFTPHLAFDEKVIWKSSDFDPEIQNSWGIGVLNDPPDTFWISQFADIRMGRPPKELGFLGVFPTSADPSQAPPGKDVCLLWQFVPYNLADGGPLKWDEIKDGYTDQMIEFMQKFVKNDLRKAIAGRYIMSPLDVERKNPSMGHGSFMHGDLAQDQFGVFRPFHDYPVGKSPIENLYLCGDAGACAGDQGRRAAWLCLDDLKMKKWWEK